MVSLSLSNKNDSSSKKLLSKFRTEDKKIGARNKILLLGFIALMVVIDQLTKLWATGNLKGGAMVIIKGVLSFEYTTNDGVAFGLFGGWVFVVIGLTSVIVLAATALLFGDVLFKNKLLYISGGLIVSGGIGNLIDRYLNGEVVDFIRFTFFNFPTFNFADICVVIGAVLLAIAVMFFMPVEQDLVEDKEESKKTEETIDSETEN